MKRRKSTFNKKDELMAAWIMRQYFDPKLHSKKPWYKTTVNEKNVLKYISDTSNKFPLSFLNTKNLWKLTQSFRKNFREAEKEIANLNNLSKKPKPKKAYKDNEETLKNIGAVLGNVTPTMINRLAATGMQKFRTLTSGLSLRELQDEELDKMQENIMFFRKKAAEGFANNLKESKGNITRFIEDYLLKRQILSKLEVRLMEDKEIEGLLLLMGENREQIQKVLLFDIGREDNLFKSYQAAVCRTAFPFKSETRGRPRKI